MDDTQRSMTDSELDRELGSALGVDPSPEFLARVRTRIASEPEALPWRLAVVSAFRRTSIESFAAVGIVGILLAAIIPQLMREGVTTVPTGPAVAARDSARDRARDRASDIDRGLPREGRKAVPAAVDIRSVRMVGRPEARETPLRLSAVLFSDDERRALQRLVMAVEEGLVPPLPETIQATDQPGDVRLPRIEPLLIEPLPQLARLEQLGASQ
jgi:hypothetical protein